MSWLDKPWGSNTSRQELAERMMVIPTPKTMYGQGWGKRWVKDSSLACKARVSLVGVDKAVRGDNQE